MFLSAIFMGRLGDGFDGLEGDEREICHDWSKRESLITVWNVWKFQLESDHC
jgi:hypothetical protein